MVTLYIRVETVQKQYLPVFRGISWYFGFPLKISGKFEIPRNTGTDLFCTVSTLDYT